jgi:hypothetical protein
VENKKIEILLKDYLSGVRTGKNGKTRVLRDEK